MTILFFFKFQQKERIAFYKLSSCFFYFNYIPAFPPLFPHFHSDSPHSHPIPRIPTHSPHSQHSHPDSPIPTPIPRISLIQFPDFSFRLLQIAVSETNENVCLFVLLHNWFPSEFVFTYNISLNIYES